jgi:hypothetical protein
MAPSAKQRCPLSLRLKMVVVSLLAFLVSSACSSKPPRETPVPLCYAEVPPATDTPEPIVMCYEPSVPAATPTYTLPPLCYTPTPYPTTFVSPISPIPTPTPEARRLLQERLLAEARFPQDVVRELGL